MIYTLKKRLENKNSGACEGLATLESLQEGPPTLKSADGVMDF